MLRTRLSSEAAPLSGVHYEAGFIVLSYIISLVGCMSALELLHRRTSTRGAFNWYLLIASSITMGGVGIWSMHFVGNRAIILANGASDRQLLYNQGFTALSFFLPILVLVVAFHLLAVSGRATKVNIFIAGLLTGTAVCAMHYVGQVGIANYDCTYAVGNIVGSAIIAVVASLIALSIFFRLRDTWTDSWWKRGMCAALLAGAVSGMHWTAALGTTYYYRDTEMPQGSRTRVQTVIFCAVLSFVACILLLAIAFVKRRRSRVHRRRAQELVLACAYFDEDDRVMVSHDGFLPYQKITNQFIRKTFGEDELNRSHPAFMWVYEASRNWSSLQHLVPRIQTQLDTNPIARRYLPDHEKSVDMSRTASADFNVIFKQLFCVAAGRLAVQLHQPMKDLGIMFEEPLETGTVKSNKAIQERLTGLIHLDSEKGKMPKFFGKGRYLFLNRRLNKTETANFAALGYRFGPIPHVAESLARNMQVSHDFMLSRLERMKICTSSDHLHPPGVHLACFLLRPNVHGGFDILVPTVSQNQLPLVTLPIKELTPSHIETLNAIDEKSVGEILKELIPNETSKTNQSKDFRWELYSTFVRLVDMVKDPQTMMDAKFSARPIKTPCRSLNGSSKQSTCTLLSVRYLGNIHDKYSQKELSYVPFSFFGAQQLVESSKARSDSFRVHAQRLFGRNLDNLQNQKQNDTGSVPSDDGPGGEDPPRSLSSQWSSQQILAKLGIPTPKKSRRSSRTGIVPDIASDRSTVESGTHNTTPVAKKEVDPSMEELNRATLADPIQAIPIPNEKKDFDRQENAIESAVSNDNDGAYATFVSELFALFRFPEVQEKGKLRQVE